MVCKFENVRTVGRFSDDRVKVTHIQVTVRDAVKQMQLTADKMKQRGRNDTADVLSAFASQAEETLKALDQPYVDLYRSQRVDDCVSGKVHTHFEIWIDDLVASVIRAIKGGHARGDGLSSDQALDNTCKIVEDIITRDNM